MKVFILEDSDDRFNKIKSCLWDSEVVREYTAKKAFKTLDEHNFDMIMLDHDLAEEHYEAYRENVFGVEVSKYRELTGMAVAEWLAENKKNCVILVHSLNSQARPKMIDVLKKAGYTVFDAAFCWELAKEADISITKYYGINEW